VIKYLGSKRLLLPHILACVRALPEVRSVLDLFSGTSRVGHALKAAGYAVTANDHNTFAHVLARCYVEADAESVAAPAADLIAELNALPGRPGWFTETYCRQARFIQPKNGGRIEAMRAALSAWALPRDLEAVCLTALVEASDRVDSTTGVQMAYLKRWSKRAERDIELRLPAVLPGAGRALHLDAAEAAATETFDVAYLDPPYNHHSYRGNYHLWETLVQGDEPETYGIARKRIDVQAHKSAFNSKPGIRAAMAEVLDCLQARYLIVSFNNEGNLARSEMLALLARHGETLVIAIDHPRYMGARIGIHNPKGVRVGSVSHVRNTEYLFVTAPDAAALAHVRRALQAEDNGLRIEDAPYGAAASKVG
jgi:adenine-specific DNA-methyltransferase